jgi:signal transduction histidine kinase/CheY-like chemotaxis protein/HPt (histidine-containing phosphotransfer) domain-containing protein
VKELPPGATRSAEVTAPLRGGRFEEQRYRRAFLREDTVRATQVVSIIGVIQLLFVRNDHLLFAGTGTFLLLVGVHLAVTVGCGVCVVLLRRARRPRAHDAAVVVAWSLIAAVMIITVMTRLGRGEYLGPAISVISLLAVAYLAQSGPLWPRALPALAMSIAAFGLMRRPMSLVSQVAPTTLLIALFALNLIGVLASRSFDANRRRRFQAEREERRARRELAVKVKEVIAEKERALALSRAKSDFLATMSHEFRTPMNAVIGFSDLLAGHPLPAEAAEHARAIRDSARALLGLLDDILDFAKIDAGRMELELAPFELRALASSVVEMLRPQAVAKGVTLGLEVSDEVPVGIEGDAGRLRQVLVNLVGNAVKFTAQGGVTLRITARPEPGPEHAIDLLVEDTGIGIAPEAVARIFRPFEQAETGTARHYGGTGLGLPISQRLVEAMGGVLRVESELDRGSIFSFTLRARAAALLPPATVSTGPLGAPLRILVVEDHPVNRRLALAMLARLGYRADTAADGFEALAAIERSAYDLVFVDVQMPGMSGIELAQQLRERAAPVPRLVAMTANAFPEDRAACERAGMVDFVAKPFDGETLAGALRRAAESIPAAVLDRGPLDELRELERHTEAGLVAGLCRDFIAETTARLARMKQALADGAAGELEREAHGLKSASAFLGAKAMSERAAAIEGAAREGLPLRGDDPLPALAAELTRVERALARELEASQAAER